MKRERAVQNLYRVLQRIRYINGLLSTFLDDHEYVKIKSAWLFGSLAKGSDQPNDVDIFIDIQGYTPNSVLRTPLIESHTRKGRHIRKRKVKGCDKARLHGSFKPDKKSELYTVFGQYPASVSTHTLYKYLTFGMPDVSVHFVHDDLIFNRLDKKIMLYPRCDFDIDAENSISNAYKRKYSTKRKLP